MKSHHLNKKKRNKSNRIFSRWKKSTSTSYIEGISEGELLAKQYLNHIQTGEFLVPALANLVVDLAKLHDAAAAQRGKIVGFFSALEILLSRL